MTKEQIDRLAGSAGLLLETICDDRNRDIVQFTDDKKERCLVFVRGAKSVEELNKCVERMACLELMENGGRYDTKTTKTVSGHPTQRR